MVQEQAHLDRKNKPHIIVISHGQVEYPAGMSPRTKHPTLSVLGNTSYLHEAGIGLCGSRKATAAGRSIATRVGELASALSLPLVSGYAPRSDTDGHVATIRSGGHTIAVLAQGIGSFSLLRDYDQVSSALEHMTVVSQFDVDARWTVINAMQRNKTICALSRLLVAVEPGRKGGTLDAIREARLQGKPRIIAIPPGTDSVVPEKEIGRLGAFLVTNEDELELAIRDVLSSEVRAPFSPVQTTLFDSDN